jgi:5'-nucleotidase
MNVVLTNDDGIRAEGLRVLRQALTGLPGVRVLVVAPDRERSASGHAITIHQPLQVEELRLEDGGPAWAVSGTPADCTKLAVEALLPEPPALVVSGINRGPNLGTDVYYSGTVSAAVESVLLGIPALAVSVTAFENIDYEFSARFAARVAARVLERGLPRDTLLNINVPALPPDQIAGVAVTRLGVRRYRNVFDRRTDPRGRVYYWMAGDLDDGEDVAGTDTAAIRQNLVSVTPIRLDLTHHGFLAELHQWVAGLTTAGCGGEEPEEE